MSEVDELRELRNDYVCFLREIVRGLDPSFCLPDRSVNHTSLDLEDTKRESLLVAKYVGFDLDATRRENEVLRRILKEEG